MPKLYDELTPWWPLISPPEEYEEEAGIYRRHLVEACDGSPQTMLELGSGGGHNASHLKAHFEMTLVDLSPGMLAMSKALNPECRHIQGDMRTARLDQTFDCVFIHDAVDYMTTLEDLRAAIETALHPLPARRRRPLRTRPPARELPAQHRLRRLRRRRQERPLPRMLV